MKHIRESKHYVVSCLAVKLGNAKILRSTAIAKYPKYVCRLKMTVNLKDHHLLSFVLNADVLLMCWTNVELWRLATGFKWTV